MNKFVNLFVKSAKIYVKSFLKKLEQKKQEELQGTEASNCT